MTGNTFDTMAAAGNPLGIAMQVSQIVLDLRGTLDHYSRDVAQAAGDRELMDTWSGAAGESRSAVLLGLAWGSRGLPLRSDSVPAVDYAAELHMYANQAGEEDSEAFHGAGFPAPPLPGPAGILASSLGFDRDDVGVSLETALILMAAAGSQSAGETPAG